MRSKEDSDACAIVDCGVGRNMSRQHSIRLIRSKTISSLVVIASA